MKTILVATDFSSAADHAARYALNLAKRMNAGIKLCNAFRVPLETPMASQIAWPVDDYASLKSKTTQELKFLAESLTGQELSGKQEQADQPVIEYISEVGPITEVVSGIVHDQSISLVVMGTSGAGPVSRFFLGSSSRSMIDKASFPVLLIPGNADYREIKKIAFATDLNMDDLNVIQTMLHFARAFDAEILLAHVTGEKVDQGELQHKAATFLNEITGKLDYAKIYYRHIKAIDVEHGLDWLSEHGQIDMLAMVHRKHRIFDTVFTGSHTQKIARHIQLPLFVLPQSYAQMI